MLQTSLIYILVNLISFCILASLYKTSWAGECQNWEKIHPEWIFCDDFESSKPLVGKGRYFEYENINGNFLVVDGAGVSGSRALRALWQIGDVNVGHISLGFGRTPDIQMNKGIRSTEDFREVYYRMYLKMEPGWQGSPAKLSRATIFNDASRSQAMIAHLWTGTKNFLSIDPVRCVNNNNAVVCNGYNDFAHMIWLGARSGTTTIFDSQHSGQWFCIEAHVKLNDSGKSNGIQEYWIDASCAESVEVLR